MAQTRPGTGRPAGPAFRHLVRLLAVHETPCGGPEGDAWISDDREDREIAALFCGDCWISNSCLAAAREINAKAGVWGGWEFPPIDRMPNEGPPTSPRRALRPDAPAPTRSAASMPASAHGDPSPAVAVSRSSLSTPAAAVAVSRSSLSTPAAAEPEETPGPTAPKETP